MKHLQQQMSNEKSKNENLSALSSVSIKFREDKDSVIIGDQGALNLKGKSNRGQNQHHSQLPAQSKHSSVDSVRYENRPPNKETKIVKEHRVTQQDLGLKYLNRIEIHQTNLESVARVKSHRNDHLQFQEQIAYAYKTGDDLVGKSINL